MRAASTSRLLQTLDELGGWRAEYGLDDAGRLVRINTIACAGSNPFPWPVGLTTVTSDANGSIRALVNGTWRAEFEVDYEGRLTEIRWFPGITPCASCMMDSGGSVAVSRDR